MRRLYDDPGAPSRIIVARIVDALSPQTRAAMADAAVARCLATLTRAGAGDFAPEALSLDPSLPAAADLAAALRACAESDIAGRREASQFGELGLDALTASALTLAGEVATPAAVRATLARYSEERRLSEVAGRFVSEDLACAFRHFVERDTPAHVGGPRLPGVSDAERLADDVAGICRQTADGVRLGGLEDDLWRAVERGPDAGHTLYRSVLTAALSDSLRALGVAP
ncbi:MAG: hypothetical protein FJX74_00615 [Armatimonadetes bacterium]|nr:hypothetical protein [Armatimonadota bacterium]